MSGLSHYQNVFRVAKSDVKNFNGSDPRATKRNRQALSCSACRVRKLKCDRQVPCGACTKRGDSTSCSYSPAGPDGGGYRRNTKSKDSEAQIRLQKLEKMVTDLMQTPNNGFQSHSEETSPQRTTIDRALEDLSVRNSAGIHEEVSPGHLELNGCEMNYLGGTHWATILENIRDIQGILQPEAEGSVHKPHDFHPYTPDIILERSGSLTLMDVCNFLSSRSKVDSLLSVYFNAKYIRNPIIHTGKFLKEYESFWADPSSVSFLWISMLLSALHIGSRINQATGKESVDAPIIPDRQPFLTMASQALVTGGYDKARPYSVEALLLYGICKFTDNEDQDTSAWMIMGVGARLAMRMGYHRDPRYLPTITPFEGEMRRRAFMIVETFDLLLSFQAGLPAIIHEEEYDTQPPSNLFDEDFDEDCKALPPSRPPTDPTPMLYYCYKGRLSKMLRRVIRHALSLKSPSYEDTMRLDHDLHEMHKEVPPSLRMRSLGSSITDEAYMILWRLNIDLLYLRSLCVLHREYIGHHRSDLSFDYSRRTCTTAALQLLKHQAELHFACQPGGRLYNDQWMLSSSMFHDFLLAAMIICLDLYELHKDPPGTTSEQAEAPVKKLDALRLSYEIWASRTDCSRDARRASRIFAVMFSKLPRLNASHNPSSVSQEESPQISTNGNNLSTILVEPSENTVLSKEAFDLLGGQICPNQYALPEATAAEPLDTIFSDPNNIDWGLIDQLFHDRSDLGDTSIDWRMSDGMGAPPT